MNLQEWSEKYFVKFLSFNHDFLEYAKANEPCIIFIDEIDAIGGRRLSQGNSSDREI